jgi:hypothetical protein
MMEERYHATTHNLFYPDMSNVNKNITVEAKLISPATYKVRESVCFHLVSLPFPIRIILSLAYTGTVLPL